MAESTCSRVRGEVQVVVEVDDEESPNGATGTVPPGSTPPGGRIVVEEVCSIIPRARMGTTRASANG